jgi:hypothetical protein
MCRGNYLWSSLLAPETNGAERISSAAIGLVGAAMTICRATASNSLYAWSTNLRIKKGIAVRPHVLESSTDQLPGSLSARIGLRLWI